MRLESTLVLRRGGLGACCPLSEGRGKCDKSPFAVVVVGAAAMAERANLLKSSRKNPAENSEERGLTYAFPRRRVLCCLEE